MNGVAAEGSEEWKKLLASYVSPQSCTSHPKGDSVPASMSSCVAPCSVTYGKPALHRPRRRVPLAPYQCACIESSQPAHICVVLGRQKDAAEVKTPRITLLHMDAQIDSENTRAHVHATHREYCSIHSRN